ncbi:HAD family hydrolase [Propionibacterium australiense]|uniref:HAD-like domain n=1 Tax=Propionibacterium australiense TaxID=119981 RepID=A0A383S988_9ACTN|nr:HAD hydrolase-like protein [Propionibacterium australiense]SYZ34570.1 HAD-like domain [Propionibacterium australiense]VEH92703.1 Pyrophosphatase ppaX [Propionibacterium australiense]
MSSTAPYELVLFDLDGTLINSIDLIVATWQYLGREVLDRPLSREEVTPLIGLPLRQAVASVVPDRPDEVARLYHEWNVAHHDEYVTAYSGMVDLVAGLRDAGLRVGVVTAKMRSLAEHGLGVCGYEGLIEVACGVEDTTRHKPDPEPLLAGLARMGGSLGSVAYVGDSVWDLRAAQAAGMPGIGVTWGAGDPGELRAEQSLAVVDTPDQLAARLLG